MNQGNFPKRPDDYGAYIQRLAKDIKYLAGENLVKHNVTIEQVKILRFLTENYENTSAYQKTIELQFGIRRSSVTNILQNMEKNDLIHRINDESDARIKRVELTVKGEELSKSMKNYIQGLEAVIVRDMTQEEKEIFKRLLLKGIQNVEGIMQ